MLEATDLRYRLSKQIEDYNQKKDTFSHLVFLCIGTDRITGDSFGPLVGHELQHYLTTKQMNQKIVIVGSLDNPVCATNIRCELEKINKVSKNPYIVAIDSAFSSKVNIGEIVVLQEGITIGNAVNKKVKKIGNMSIRGVVAKDYQDPNLNFTVLQHIPLGLVMKMAKKTAKEINTIINTNL